MASPAQIAANRRNAQHSTGLVHRLRVLLPDEHPVVFEELREFFQQQFNRHFYPTEAQAEKIGFGSLGQSFTIEGLGQDNFSRLARYEPASTAPSTVPLKSCKRSRNSQLALLGKTNNGFPKLFSLR